MAIRINIEYVPDACGAAGQLREILCRVHQETFQAGWNPLIETDFNDKLKEECQRAFDEGRAFEKRNPSLA